jgi:hypothetical protein
MKARILVELIMWSMVLLPLLILLFSWYDLQQR